MDVDEGGVGGKECGAEQAVASRASNYRQTGIERKDRSEQSGMTKEGIRNDEWEERMNVIVRWLPCSMVPDGLYFYALRSTFYSKIALCLCLCSCSLRCFVVLLLYSILLLDSSHKLR